MLSLSFPLKIKGCRRPTKMGAKKQIQWIHVEFTEILVQSRR